VPIEANVRRLVGRAGRQRRVAFLPKARARADGGR
jgi:hypothetical protein